MVAVVAFFCGFQSASLPRMLNDLETTLAKGKVCDANALV